MMLHRLTARHSGLLDSSFFFCRLCTLGENAPLLLGFMLAALLGACLGFLPYNLNPAKIFMGDVGSQFLGFVLSTISILGLFKLQAIITFFLPLLALAVPPIFGGLSGLCSAAAAAGAALCILHGRKQLGGMSGDISGLAVTVGEFCGLLVLALV